MLEENKNRPSRARLGRLNKTLLIKQVARELRDKTESRSRPRDICRTLSSMGVNVSSPQVSQALAGTDLAWRQKLRATQAEPSGLCDPFEVPSFESAIAQIGLDDLIFARDYVLKVGTLEKAVSALVVFKQLKKGEKAQPEVGADQVQPL